LQRLTNEEAATVYLPPIPALPEDEPAEKTRLPPDLDTPPLDVPAAIYTGGPSAVPDVPATIDRGPPFPAAPEPAST
jgi:hypothetical protein